MSNIKLQKKQLRQQLRQARRNLSHHQQQLAAKALLRTLGNHPAFVRSQRIGAYVAFDGELDPKPALIKAISLDKQTYLPVIHPTNGSQLLFAPWQPSDKLQRNHLAIAEPRLNQSGFILPRWLDLVLVPFVGIDHHGHRLGIGGGFYDRTFAHQGTQRPFLLGIGHHCQLQPQLPTDPWDVHLDDVILV